MNQIYLNKFEYIVIILRNSKLFMAMVNAYGSKLKMRVIHGVSSCDFCHLISILFKFSLLPVRPNISP